MFGGHFYHERIRRSVAIFGALFNNIYIVRKNSSGNIISQVKVPLSYGPKRKFIERINENPDLVNDTKTAIKLPRMSFEILSIQYDSTRQLSKVNRFSRATSDTNKRTNFYTGVPYTINFQLSVYAKSQDDALQVVEQVIPYFTPQYSLTIKPFSDYPDIKEDVPITIQSIDFSDDYESALEQRRTIIYSMTFEMKINFYGPIEDMDIIRKVMVDFYLKDNGLNDSDQFVEGFSITPDPADADPEDDYGFSIEWRDEEA
jgi:hypothetical protein